MKYSIRCCTSANGNVYWIETITPEEELQTDAGLMKFKISSSSSSFSFDITWSYLREAVEFFRPQLGLEVLILEQAKTHAHVSSDRTFPVQSWLHNLIAGRLPRVERISAGADQLGLVKHALGGVGHVRNLLHSCSAAYRYRTEEKVLCNF